MVSQPFDSFLEAFQKLSGFSSHTIPSQVSISNRTESSLCGDGEGKDAYSALSKTESYGRMVSWGRAGHPQLNHISNQLLSPHSFRK